MTSIFFDKDQYNCGEEARIEYIDAPSDGWLQVIGPYTSYPYSKGISGDGTEIWLIPTDAPLGQYRVELVSRTHGKMAHDTMEVVSGAAPPPTDKGTLKVNTSPVGATVTVNGTSCGVTPVYACELSTGSKTATITKLGYTTVTRSITITAGQPSDLGTITLTPTGAPPVGFTDTEKVTPSTIEVDPATYDVMFKKSGYKDKIISNVVVSEGATKTVSATLEPEAPVTKTVTFLSVPSGASVNVVAV